MSKLSMQDVLYFVSEREKVRMNKEAGEVQPWTNDEILQTYRFCNIRRKHDRVSEWLIYKYYAPLILAGNQDVWFAAAIARLINWPPSLEVLKDLIPETAEEFNPYEFVKALEKFQAAGNKTFTGAYMLYAGRSAGAGISKPKFIAEQLLPPLIDNANKIRWSIEDNSLEKTVTALSSGFGISTFMAGQIAADLTYIPFQLESASDLHTYAPIGPGSTRGLNRLHGRTLNAAWKQNDFNAALSEVLTEIRNNLKIEDLTLHDVQNIFCEVDKYYRVKFGEGKPRSFYKPETAYYR